MVVYEDGPFDFFTKLRGYIYGKFDIEHWIARGFNCVLCVSFWIAFGFSAFIADSLSNWFLMSVGVAGAVAVISELIDQ